jgi:hypothetical protein
MIVVTSISPAKARIHGMAEVSGLTWSRGPFRVRGALTVQ